MTNSILILVLMLLVILLGGFCCYLCTIKRHISAVCIVNNSYLTAVVYVNGVAFKKLHDGDIWCDIVPINTRISIAYGMRSVCFSTKANKVSEEVLK